MKLSSLPFILVPLFSLPLEAREIDVFYTSKDSIAVNLNTTLSVNYYQLDKPAELKEKLNSNFKKNEPENLDAIVSYARNFMTLTNTKAQLQEMYQSYQDLALAFKNGIKAVPAVVIDKTYVVYGTTDVNRAIRETDAFWA